MAAHFACCRKAASLLQAMQNPTRTALSLARSLLTLRPKRLSCRASFSVISSLALTDKQLLGFALSHAASGGHACTPPSTSTHQLNEHRTVNIILNVDGRDLRVLKLKQHHTHDLLVRAMSRPPELW